MARSCDIEGCADPHLAKGMCKRHYSRAYRGLATEPAEYVMPDWVSEAEIAYAAGFIDADGSILIERGISNGRIRHSPRICAAGIERAPLEFLQELFSGNICPQRRTKTSGPIQGRFDVWQWSVTDARAIGTARAIMPYLRIKGVQAYLLSCFDYEAKWRKGGTDPAMPKEELQRREELVSEMRGWNGKDHLKRTR